MNKRYKCFTLSVFLLIFFVSGTVFGATTIGTNISTDGSLDVSSTSTLSVVKISSLSGFLKAVGGYVQTAVIDLASDITGLLGISHGGTGTTTAPAFGQVLVGNSSGTGYDLVSTSSLLGLGSASQVFQMNDSGTAPAWKTFSGTSVLSAPAYIGTPQLNLSSSTAYELEIGPRLGNDSTTVSIHGNYDVVNSGVNLQLGGISFDTSIGFNVSKVGLADYTVQRTVCGTQQGFTIYNNQPIAQFEPDEPDPTNAANSFSIRDNGNVGIRTKALCDSINGLQSCAPYTGKKYNIDTHGSFHMDSFLDVDGDVNISSTTISRLGYMDFTKLPSQPSATEGRIYYDSTTKTLQLATSDSNSSWVIISSSTASGGGGSGGDVYSELDNTFTQTNTFQGPLSVIGGGNLGALTIASSTTSSKGAVAINTTPLATFPLVITQDKDTQNGLDVAIVDTRPYYAALERTSRDDTYIRFGRNDRLDAPTDPGTQDFTIHNSASGGVPQGTELFKFGGSNNYDKQPVLFFSTNKVIAVGCTDVGNCQSNIDTSQNFQVMGPTRIDGQLTITTADLVISSSTSGVVLHATDDNTKCFRVQVNSTGVLSASSTTCL